MRFYFFFFNDTATTEIYTLSLHDALPIYARLPSRGFAEPRRPPPRIRLRNREPTVHLRKVSNSAPRSEEHTSELQSRQYLVCRLLLEKKKKIFEREKELPKQRLAAVQLSL